MPSKTSGLKLALTVVLLALLMAVSAAYFCWSWLHTPISVPESARTLVINRGDTLTSVARELQARGLLKYPPVWSWYSRLLDADPIKAGEFALAASESPVSILNHLQSGDVIQYRVTLVDGHTYRQFLDTLHAQPKIQKQLAGLSTAEQLQQLGLEVVHPEGWFFPDTYQYQAGDSDVMILSRAYQRMQQTLETLWLERAQNLPYKTPYDALIMASIVERETGVDYERADIAGVFVRRLAKGMRLQTDPTVIYGLGERYQGNITRAHLQELTPYNTYRINGLPPTPIANPGSEAIHAALNPADGKALYFVAKGDGTHYFSSTLAEHNEAVRKYQHKRVENYRSSPTLPKPEK